MEHAHDGHNAPLRTVVIKLAANIRRAKLDNAIHNHMVARQRLSVATMAQVAVINGRERIGHVGKVAEAGLTLVDPVANGVPAIAEAPITLECKVIYRQPQDLSLMPKDVLDRFYPADVPSTDCGSNRDAHVAYYGEIVASYVLED